MSDPDNFIARWSRRKRAAAEHADEKSPEESKPPATSGAATERAQSGDIGACLAEHVSDPSQLAGLVVEIERQIGRHGVLLSRARACFERMLRSGGACR